MYTKPNDHRLPEDIPISEDVVAYIDRRGCDFRVCTSCGGPLLLPVTLKPPKPTDLQKRAGEHIIFISIHQARYLNAIQMDMLPLFLDQLEDIQRHELC
jgi:hypothetical protein